MPRRSTPSQTSATGHPSVASVQWEEAPSPRSRATAPRFALSRSVSVCASWPRSMRRRPTAERRRTPNPTVQPRDRSSAAPSLARGAAPAAEAPAPGSFSGPAAGTLAGDAAAKAGSAVRSPFERCAPGGSNADGAPTCPSCATSAAASREGRTRWSGRHEGPGLCRRPPTRRVRRVGSTRQRAQRRHRTPEAPTRPRSER
jgi:hypothetical protein